jgi:uncharacterized membrane protein
MILSVAVALFLELWFEREPLWLDEAWTIAIAGQSRWGDFFHQVYWDVNAPLYYLFIHLWQSVFGLSDLSLRLPSLVFATATPLVAALSRTEGLPDEDRLTWAAILALWFPALSFAQEARCYAMLLLICTLQCVAFIRLLQAPDLRRAAVWASLAALSILTHYDAIFPAAMQGLVYLTVYRSRAVKTWPAALAFVPAFGWLLYHLPRIVLFAKPSIAWYALLQLSDLTQIGGFLIGSVEALAGLVIVAALALIIRLAWPRRSRVEGPEPYVWWAVAPSVVGAVILVVIGFFRPSFTFRYLTPDAPGILLGLVLVARVIIGRRVGLAYVELIVLLGFATIGRVYAGDRMAPHSYNYEVASRMLEKSHPRRAVFLWDHPVDPILHPEQLAAAGDAFFHRDGLRLAVDPVILKPGEDPNARLMKEAAAPGSVILWVYDTEVQGTAARRYPPRISTLDPSWLCRRYGGGDRFAVYACERAPSA